MGDALIPRRLLLVDADAGSRNLPIDLFQREGRSIRCAHEIGEALAYARETPCDLVVASHDSDPSAGLRLARRWESDRRGEARVRCRW